MERPASQDHLKAFSANTADISFPPAEVMPCLSRDLIFMSGAWRITRNPKILCCGVNLPIRNNLSDPGLGRLEAAGFSCILKDILKLLLGNKQIETLREGFKGHRREPIYSGKHHAGYALQVSKQISENPKIWLTILDPLSSHTPDQYPMLVQYAAHSNTPPSFNKNQISLLA